MQVHIYSCYGMLTRVVLFYISSLFVTFNITDINKSVDFCYLCLFSTSSTVSGSVENIVSGSRKMINPADTDVRPNRIDDIAG